MSTKYDPLVMEEGPKAIEERAPKYTNLCIKKEYKCQ